MKYAIFLLIFLALLSGCAPEQMPETQPSTTAEVTEVPVLTTEPPVLTEPAPTETTLPPLELTDEEQEMLLKLAMAELGAEGCPECLALVMRTVLNRVESGGFGSSIKSVIFAQDQFTRFPTAPTTGQSPTKAATRRWNWS